VLVRLTDSRDRSDGSTLGGWLNDELALATAFRVQTAYYSDGALFANQKALARLLDAGGDFDLVIGGNPSAAQTDHLKTLIDFLSPDLQARVRVVLPGGSRMLVHSKLYHVESPDHTAARSGSANFTSFGLSANFEAGMPLTRARRGMARPSTGSRPTSSGGSTRTTSGRTTSST